MGDDAPDESADVAKEEIPLTTTLDLENGIFNLVITLIHEHMGAGATKQEASARVAHLLERYSVALLDTDNQEEK